MLRLPLVVICFFLCTRCLLADGPAVPFLGPAFTLDEISSFLRSDISSEGVMRFVAYAHVYGTFDSEREKEFIQLHASPALIEALKSGKYAQSETEYLTRLEAAKQQANVLENDPAIEIEGKRILQQADAITRERAQRNSEIVVVPAQTGPDLLTPSEVARAEQAARAAKIAARKKYCEAHPVECEILQAAKDARDAAQSSAGWNLRSR